MAHRSTRTGRTFAVGILALAMASTACSTQQADPEQDELQPIRALDVAVGQQEGPVDLDVDGGDGGIRITYRRVSMQPGAASGLHCLHGQVVVVVEKGEITHFAESDPGGVRVYGVGESIIIDTREIHEGRNLGEETADLMITHLTPDGMPLTEHDLAQRE